MLTPRLLPTGFRSSRTRTAGTLLAAALVGGLALAAGPAPGGAATVRPGAARVAAAPANPDASGTTWLCRPGLPADPCDGPLSAVSIAANGAKTVVHLKAARAPKFDCFYIFPTVTPSAASSNGGLAVTPLEIATAQAQASQFSQVCNVWAPTYRQRTSASLAKGLGNDPRADLISYNSLLAGWKDYLAHYNHGRPVILIGHSQGAANAIRLLKGQFDNNAGLRHRLVAALVMGGNVQVPVGKTVGGTFAHIPACTSPTQTACVIAYSSFSKPPPADSLFGRPGEGVSLQTGQTSSAGQQVLCTNPAALAGGSAPLTPYFPSAGSTGATTPWVTYPGLYTGSCQSAGGATWLQVTATLGDPRPKARPTLGPTWGLHLDDVNLPLGNLVADVHAEETAYLATHR